MIFFLLFALAFFAELVPLVIVLADVVRAAIPEVEGALGCIDRIVTITITRPWNKQTVCQIFVGTVYVLTLVSSIGSRIVPMAKVSRFVFRNNEDLHGAGGVDRVDERVGDSGAGGGLGLEAALPGSLDAVDEVDVLDDVGVGPRRVGLGTPDPP